MERRYGIRDSRRDSVEQRDSLQDSSAASNKFVLPMCSAGAAIVVFTRAVRDTHFCRELVFSGQRFEVPKVCRRREAMGAYSFGGEATPYLPTLFPKADLRDPGNVFYSP